MVDDEPMNLIALQNNLEMAVKNLGRDKTIVKFLLDEVISGQEAIDKFTEICETDKRYALIFMDISMPVKDGFAAS